MQLRNYLPKTLFGRMLSIIMVPMILVQLITIFIFYERHWDTVTRHMASQLAADIGLLADRLGLSFAAIKCSPLPCRVFDIALSTARRPSTLLRSSSLCLATTTIGG